MIQIRRNKQHGSKFIAVSMVLVMTSALVGCSNSTSNGNAKEASTENGETIVLHILENDTAKSEGYLQELLDAFNAAYADKGIQAVDANMDEYTDLATNGPYGYGPDVLYQANDKLMTYAEDKHILPLTVDEFDCYEYIPDEAWEAFRMNFDGETYCFGVPVNIQEPMLFYREDKMPENWESEWDKNQNQRADFFENWNDLYAYSQYLRDTDESANKDGQYGYMASLNNLYLSSQFVFSYGGYVFGENGDGTLNVADIGFAAGDTVNGMSALKQMAALMNEGCIDDTITLNRYEKVADGSYFCCVSTPDTYGLFVEKLALQYETQDGLSKQDALKKAQENLKMVELPGLMPADGDLSRSSQELADDEWVSTVVMGGVNGYGISSYTEHREACVEFVNFATSYDMIKTRAEMLGIAPTRSDVAKQAGDTSDVIFKNLAEGRIYLMPSVKAVDQIWVPTQTIMGDIAKDAFREKNNEGCKYLSHSDYEEAMEIVNQNIYDAIFTLTE
ncbi:MAG: extracellular solute-binding protein [Lachnospiraceae bacterium]|nr:extracellular solute-binding protein [Lachnospiraceae bacterium]